MKSDILSQNELTIDNLFEEYKTNFTKRITYYLYNT